jgi:hypothetical protein
MEGSDRYQFEVLSCNLPEVTEQNHKELPVKIVSSRTHIRGRDPPAHCSIPNQRTATSKLHFTEVFSEHIKVAV